MARNDDLYPDAPVDQAPESAAEAEAPQETVTPEPEATEEEVLVNVSLNPDAGLESPAAVSVPGLVDSGVELDEYDRLVLDESPTQVPAKVANALDGLPYVKIEAAD